MTRTVDADWDPHSRLLTTAEAAESVGEPEWKIRDWRRAGLLAPYSTATVRGRERPLYLEVDVLLAAARAASSRARSGATRRARGRHVAGSPDDPT